jgi:hypothetical protein
LRAAPRHRAPPLNPRRAWRPCIPVKIGDILDTVILLTAAVGTILYTRVTGIDLSNTAVGAFAVVGLKVAQQGLRLYQAQTRYSGMLAKALQSKSADSQLGMLVSLLESMEDQECKEMILCYCVLSAGEMTVDQIEVACERVLLERFGLRVDLDAQGTVRRLVEQGLVQPRQGGRTFAATPLEQALEEHRMGGLDSPAASYRV